MFKFVFLMAGALSVALTQSSLYATAVKLLEYDAASAGAGVTPSGLGWTQFGTPMVNNGTYLLQDNTGVAGEQSGEYLSPTLPTGTFIRGGADYGIEFRVRPLSDVRFVGNAWPEMYLLWSDDQFNYNITVDKFGNAATSGTGDIVYGRGSFSPAITGIDWSIPHTIFIGHRGDGTNSVFDFYLDGVIKSTVVDGSIARSLFGSFAQNAIDFGDGTTGDIDVAGEWYFVRVWDVNDPALTTVPEASTSMLCGIVALVGGAVRMFKRNQRA